MLNHQTFIHYHNQPNLPCRFGSMLINNTQLQPNYKNSAKHGFKRNDLLNNRRNILWFPENVDYIDSFLDFNRNIKKAFIAFLAQYFVDEGVNRYDAIPVLL